MTSGKTVPQSHDIFVLLVGELIGVSLLAIVADINERMGTVVLALMLGWLLIFVITNADWLQGLVVKL